MTNRDEISAVSEYIYSRLAFVLYILVVKWKCRSGNAGSGMRVGFELWFDCTGQLASGCDNEDSGM